jgi:serine/threonine-protein kinase
VLIDNVDPPLGFGESQAISLRGWRGDRSDPRYQAVLAAIERATGVRPSSTAPVARSQLRVDRRTAMAGAGVAVVAVAGMGAWTLLKPATANASSNSIAVLPFENLSGDPAQAYFSDGVADEIRSSLARIAGLKVAGSTSSKAVRNDDAKIAAKKLGVGNILTGTVRQSPSTIRIAAELIDGHTGMDRWSQDYDRQPGDSIKIQTDIAENVATALSAALEGAARAAATVGGTSNAQAHDLFLRAAAPARESSKVSAEERLDLLNAAIRLDPNYADAYARKAIVIRRLTDAFSTNSAQFDSGRAEALQVAQTATKLAPRLAMGHVALGQVYRSGLHVPQASAELQRALELAPGDADALRTYSYFVSLLGDQAKALALAERAISLDPLNSSSYDNRLSILFNARRYADAIDAGLQLKRSSPELLTFPTTLGDCFMMAGKIDESRQSYAAAPADDLFRLTGEAVLAARTADAPGARARLARIQQVSGDAASYQFGEIYAQLGAADEAFRALDHAWQIKDAGLLHLRVDPWMDPVRSDRRFAALVGRIGFPAA